MGGDIPTIRKKSIVVRIDRHLSTTLDDEAVVLDPDGGVYYGMNGVGTELWEQLRTPTRVAELESLLASKYDVNEAAVEADVREYISNLVEAGLVEIREQQDAV